MDHALAVCTAPDRTASYSAQEDPERMLLRALEVVGQNRLRRTAAAVPEATMGPGLHRRAFS